MRIAILLARHGTEAYPTAMQDLAAFYRRRLPEVAHELLVIDNAQPPGERRSLPQGALIGASNAAGEFSAWDEGLAWFGPRLLEFDLVHLATSAFGTLYTAYIERFDLAMLGRLRGRAAAVGHIDWYGEPVMAAGRTLRSWLRSAFLFLSPLELRLLGSVVSVGDPTRYFSGDPAAPFRADAPLSARYRQYILDWLTGEGTGQGVAWHSRFALCPATLPRFEAKATAILNEQLLTARLRAQGCRAVDATWLATRHAALPADRPLGAIPGWREQVTGRDRDAAPDWLRPRHGQAGRL